MQMKFPTLLAVLMASVSMTACVEEPMEDEVQTTQKDAYATLDQCLEDWGDKEALYQGYGCFYRPTTSPAGTAASKWRVTQPLLHH